jgi:hypothetical protein
MPCAALLLCGAAAALLLVVLPMLRLLSKLCNSSVSSCVRAALQQMCSNWHVAGFACMHIRILLGLVPEIAYAQQRSV